MSATWESRGGLPVLVGCHSLPEHVQVWNEVAGEQEERFWKLGAIAYSLKRSAGGRPGPSPVSLTTIQKFCKWVNIDRQSFQRYSKTYRVFATHMNLYQIGTSSGDETAASPSIFKDPDLKFTHFEVAARLCHRGKEAVAAVEEARTKRWTAKLLERELTLRRRSDKKPDAFSLKKEMHRIREEVLAWPPECFLDTADDLRALADTLETNAPEPAFDVDAMEVENDFDHVGQGL
jgi:hypothetical protein